MQKILTVCGPTGVGKTNFACGLAKEFQGELISADSREVYKQMDIGTGKDIPAAVPFKIQTTFQADHQQYDIGTYDIDSTSLWLYDIALPTQPVSSAVYRLAVLSVLKKIQKLPIVVGGTGYYIKSLLYPPDTISIPPNGGLRQQLDTLTLIKLQEKLKQLNYQKWEVMNHSDQSNPRRLVRAIEVALSLPYIKIESSPFDSLIIGLTATKEVIKQRIIERVDKRINQGFEKEVQNLIEMYPNFCATPAGHTLGYYEWGRYLNGEINKKQARDLWILSEVQYSKRQMTWFNKNKDIIWFDILSDNWYAQAKQTIGKWIENGTNKSQN